MSDTHDDGDEEQAESENLRPPESEAESSAFSFAGEAAADDLSQLQSASRGKIGKGLTGGPRVSRLGLISILVAIVAGVLLYVPVSFIDTKIVAVSGAGIGVLAMLVALATRRSGTSIPLIGIILGGVAAGVALYAASPKADGTLSGWVKHQFDRFAPSLEPRPIAQPSARPSPAARQPAPPTGPQPGAYGVGTGTIFDGRAKDAPSQPRRNADDAASATPPALSNVPAVPDSEPAAPATPAVPVGVALAARDAAQRKLKGAQDAVMARLAADPAYKAAKAEADAADAQLQKLKQNYDAFSAPLTEAARVKLEAQSKVSRVVTAAMQNDPAVTAARHDLDETEQTLRPPPGRKGGK